MEHNQIVYQNSPADLLNQYIEVAFTSTTVMDISPEPYRYRAWLAYPSCNKAATLEFVRFYKHQVISNWQLVYQWKVILNTLVDAPALLLHEISSSLVCRTSDGVVCVQVLPEHVYDLTAYLKPRNLVFDASELAKPIDRKHPRMTLAEIFKLQTKEATNDQ